MWPTSIAVWKRSVPPHARAASPLARLAQVGEARPEVAAVLDAAQVEAGPVRAGDELPLPQRLVGDDLAGEADRAERAGIGAEGGADLLLGGGPSALGDRVAELLLGEAVVAAHEREHDRAVLTGHRHRLRRRGLVDPEQLGKRLDRRHPGRLDLLRRVEALREHRRRAARRVAISRSAA